MKEKVKKIAIWIGSIIIALVFLLSVVFAIFKDRNKTCKSVVTHVDYESGNNFINEKEIDQIIKHSYADKLVGNKFIDIPMHSIEQKIKKNNYVRDVQLYSDMNSKLHVDVTQKTALVRIINNNGVSYYLSNIGDTIPLSTNFTSRVLVVQGDISKNRVDDIMKLSKYITENEFWNAAVEHVFIENNGDYTLYTKLGNQKIIVGKIDDDLEIKFKKLNIVYKEMLPVIDFNKYKTINLKYKGQVVCSKI